MIEKKTYIKLQVEAAQNLAYRKTKEEWSQPYTDKHSVIIEDTLDNRVFIAMLSRICSNEEYIKSMGFTIASSLP